VEFATTSTSWKPGSTISTPNRCRTDAEWIEVSERNSAVADSDGDATELLAFIEAQTKRLKKSDIDELSPLKLSRAVAAMADVTDQDAPDADSEVFLTAWKRSAQCHHFWGPTVGQERFCTKCQMPRSAATPEEGAKPARRRT
jgi:hypothetical protein